MTGTEDDLRLAQLLCSRICHDLVGSAGAVNAGLELLTDGDTLDDAALHLAIGSGAELANRLAFFRVAFGAGGAGRDGADLRALRTLAINYFGAGQVALDWPAEDQSPGAGFTVVLGRLLLNLVLIANECLPRGGTVSVRLAALAGGVGLAVSAEGAGAKLREDVARAMTPRTAVSDLDSRNVHGLVVQLLVVSA
ncbi:MAG: histidine phosphotransferase family protein, partial [Proteobacteria bacterium]|nr:histidine phosphotransferase family protein [Pseudomonadota bacterium]